MGKKITFLLGALWMFVIILIGRVNSLITNGEYANGICIAIMSIWLFGGIVFMFENYPNRRKGKENLK